MAYAEETKQINLSCGLSILLKRLQRKDLDDVHKMAMENSWNDLLNDFTDCYDYQPSTFFGAFRAGKPEELLSACISGKWGNSIGFVYLLITKKNYRRKGIGSHTMHWACQQIDCPNIILDAVEGTLPMYAKFNFTNILKEIKGFYASAYKKRDSKVLEGLRKSFTVETLSESNINQLFQFDKSIYPFDRTEFLKIWINSEVSIVRVAIQDGKCVGYIVLRMPQLHKIIRIAPLYALSTEIAQCLLENVVYNCEQTPGRSYELYIPDPNMESALKVYHEVFEEIEEGESYITLAYDNIEVIPDWSPVYATCFISTCLL